MSNPPRNRTVGEYIYDDIEKNEYLLFLYDELLKMYSRKVFKRPIEEINTKYLNDLLRFADILSKSIHYENSGLHKIWGQQIVALLDKLYPNNSTIKAYKYSILETCSNYQGLKNDKNIGQDINTLEQILTQVNKNYFAVPFHADTFFFKDQKEVFDEIKKGHLSYSAPTSQGKSFVMKVFIREQIIKGSSDNFAIIVPTKALINETRHKMLDELKEDNLIMQKDYRVVTSTGDIALEQNHHFIFIMTPERFLYLLNTTNYIAKYVFIDEAHKISSNDKRSAYYYQIVSKVIKSDTCSHIIFASPNIPNPEEYLKLINSPEPKSSHHSSYAPVSQIKYLINIAQGSVEIYNEFSNKLIKIGNNSQKKLKDIINLIGTNEQNLVYCNSIQETINQAVEYALSVDDTNDATLIQLSKDIQREISVDYFLAKLIKKGVAYHVGYLPTSIRVRIEDAYKKGIIKVLFCTSTLIEGVNLPADNLFITSYKNGLRKLDEVTFRNLIGRVGRIDHSLFGNVYLINLIDNTANETNKYIELLSKEIPPQQLSIDCILKPTLKKVIVEAVLNKNFEMTKKPINTTIDDFEFMRKVGTAIIDDIKNNNDSVIVKAFSKQIDSNNIEKIKEIYKDVDVNNRVNTTPDQYMNIKKAVETGLVYPKLIHGKFDLETTKQFLDYIGYIFKWDVYEKSTLGKLSRNDKTLCSIPYYAQLLNKWMSGNGLSLIIQCAIEYKENHPDTGIWINNFCVAERYDEYNINHKNYVIAETLSNIENVILFSIANYFREISSEIKRYYNIEHFENDWYEYVEYGTTSSLMITLQRNGYTRETAKYIIDYKDKYIDFKRTNSYANFSLNFNELIASKNENVKIETEDIAINIPELFINN